MRPKLLYVASRWPWPVDSGRKRMIDQAVNLALQTHDVYFTAFATEREVDAGSGPVSCQKLSRPGPLEILKNVVGSPGAPLQTNLFKSRQATSVIEAMVRAVEPDVVVIDMLRLASYVDVIRKVAPECRIVLDMDDLLSDRYRQMRLRREGGILGAFTSSMPKPVRMLADLAPLPLLAWEERAVRWAEAQAPASVDAITLVSQREAAALKRSTGAGIPIVGVPPVVETVSMLPRDFSEGMRFVFLGNEEFAPNAEALRHLDGIAGEFLRRYGGSRKVAFESVGKKDERLKTDHVIRHGFVDDLDAFLGKDAVMVAPIMTGTGIKTKVLDAMARSIPVVGTPKAMEGLDIEWGRHVAVYNGPTDLVDALLEIASGDRDGIIADIGIQGARYVAEVHSRQSVGAIFHAVLSGAKDAIPDEHQVESAA